MEIKQAVTVPEIRNITIKEAIEKLKEVGLDYNINYEGEINQEEEVVKEQLPKPGLSINSGTKVEIYIE